MRWRRSGGSLLLLWSAVALLLDRVATQGEEAEGARPKAVGLRPGCLSLLHTDAEPRQALVRSIHVRSDVCQHSRRRVRLLEHR